MTIERRPRNLEQDRIERALVRRRDETRAGALAEAVQAVLGHVPPAAFASIAERADCSPETVGELVEQSADLHTAPPARHRVTICTGRTCARRGGAELVRMARRVLEVNVFETSGDGAVHLEPFRCFGQCAMAPNIRIDGGVRGAMTRERLELLLDMLRRGSRD